MDALCTDLYQLTMAAGYFHRGMAGVRATCEMFVRRLPSRRRYLVAMGLERALGYLADLRFSEAQVAYLGTVPGLRDAMTPAFCEYLRAFRFTGDVAAVPEGTVVFATEPLVRVTAPLIEAQLVETYLLSCLNHATGVASKAARIVLAAGDAKVVEFGSRRTHPDAALDAARAACAVGCAGTSNVEAGMRFGLPVVGTAAHMWTMAHPSEEAAFEAYVAVFPSASILLIDTYDTVQGAARAAIAAREKLRGVRLDSGDLDLLSREVRRVLDEHGCKQAEIIASGDLNEYRIAELRRAGAPIDLYGVGTDLVTSLDAPALGGVYKLVELERDGRREPIAKFSEGKATLPGAHQVLRYRDAEGRLAGDLIVLCYECDELREGPEGPARADPRGSLEHLGPLSRPAQGPGEPLLVDVMRAGLRRAPPEPIAVVQARARRELASLPPALLALEEWPPMMERAMARPSARCLALLETVRARVASAVTTGQRVAPTPGVDERSGRP